MPREEEKAWLGSLAVGDEVFISQRHGAPIKDTVGRLTKTRIVIKRANYELQFRRDDGRSIGGSSWDRQWLLRPSDEVRERAEVSALYSKARRMAECIVVPKTKAELLKFIDTLSALSSKEA